MPLFNVFVPGVHPRQINIAPLAAPGQQKLTTERSVAGVMFYGVNAANVGAAQSAVLGIVGNNYTEALSVFQQSNDNRVG